MCSIDCADATCEVINQSGIYDAKMIGPDSHPYLKFNKQNISDADCLVFPGGDGDADQFDNSLYKHKRMVQEYVSLGGKYLGICQGGYFASRHYFDLLGHIKAEQHIKRKGASARRDGAAVVPIIWRDQKPARIYFHDGASFVPDAESDLESCEVLGRYHNGDAAALIQPFWDGAVGVFGPHPEAMRWWFYSQWYIKNDWKRPLQHHLLLDLLSVLLNKY